MTQYCNMFEKIMNLTFLKSINCEIYSYFRLTILYILIKRMSSNFKNHYARYSNLQLINLKSACYYNNDNNTMVQV